MLRKIAVFISIFFHPLLIPSIITALIMVAAPYTYQNNNSLAWLILGFVFVFTYVLPVVSMILFQKLGLISSLNLVNRKERLLPYIITSVYFFGISYIFFKNPVIHVVYPEVLFIMGICIVFVSVINVFHKISAHATGVGGLLGVILRLTFFDSSTLFVYVLVTSILITGLVCTSRLFLNAHKPLQIYNGLGLGLILSLVGAFVLI